MSATKFAAKTLGTAAALTALYAITGYVAVPLAVQWGINKYLTPVLGAEKTTAGSIRFNPWNWQLTVQGLNAKKAEKTILSVRELFVDLSSESLSEGAPVVSALHIDALKGSIETAIKSASASAKNAQKGTQAAAEVSEASTSLSLPKFSVADFTVKESSLSIINSQNKEQLVLQDVDFSMPLLSTLSNTQAIPETAPKLSLRLNGTPIKAHGKTYEKGAELSVSLTNLDVAKIVKALGVKTPGELVSLKADAALTLSYAKESSGTVSLAVKAKTQGRDLVYNAPAQGLSVRIPLASVDITEMNLARQQARIASVSLTNPSISATLTKTATKKASAKTSIGSTGAASAASKQGEWSFNLDKAEIKNGVITLIDRTAKPQGTIQIKQLFAEGKNLSTLKNQASPFSMSAALLGGNASASGKLSLFPLSVSADTKAAALNLSDLNPWLQRLSGVELKRAALTASGSVRYSNTGNISWRGSASVDSFSAAKNGSTLFSFKESKAENIVLNSVNPIDFTVGVLTLQEPAQNVTKTVNKVSGILGAIAQLAGKDKYVKKLEKTQEKLQKEIRLKDLSYHNGSLSVHGYSKASLEGAAASALARAFSKQ